MNDYDASASASIRPILLGHGVAIDDSEAARIGSTIRSVRSTVDSMIKDETALLEIGQFRELLRREASV
ncbi:hypothetical protein [Mycobacterium montefiorense]|uniref:hypothetical protein n=1 Tax=Mycobacterium montefiorense TaxID=154654 RepID=UPI0021F38FF3|nr:hypothetical protein [Mycobacterium montefiorense]MCV7427402.1 hypothetical protein [Mycobacterium montefiorense]